MQKINLVNSNYIWRIFFTFLIVIGHTGWVDISHASYYIGVDYFFIISGLMIAYGVERGGGISTFDYTISRIKKLYPHLILTFVCYFTLIFWWRGWYEALCGLVSYLYQILPMMYYIMPSSPSVGYMNFAVWYISIMLIVGIFVHYMYSQHKNAFINCVAPLISLVGYYFFVRNFKCFNVGDTVGLFTNAAYIRGLTDMCGGVVIYTIILRVKRYHFSRLAYVLFRILEIATYMLLLYFIRFAGNSNNDFYFVLLIYAGVLLSFLYPEKWGMVFDRFKPINDFMYPVYLNHLFWMEFLRWLEILGIQVMSEIMVRNKVLGIVLFLISLCIWSWMTMKVLEIMKVVWKYLRRYLIVG